MRHSPLAKVMLRHSRSRSLTRRSRWARPMDSASTPTATSTEPSHPRFLTCRSMARSRSSSTPALPKSSPMLRASTSSSTNASTKCIRPGPRLGPTAKEHVSSAPTMCPTGRSRPIKPPRRMIRQILEQALSGKLSSREQAKILTPNGTSTVPMGQAIEFSQPTARRTSHSPNTAPTRRMQIRPMAQVHCGAKSS